MERLQKCRVCVLAEGAQQLTCRPAGCEKASRAADAVAGMEEISCSAVSAWPALSLAASSCCTPRASTVFMPCCSGSAHMVQGHVSIRAAAPVVQLGAELALAAVCWQGKSQGPMPCSSMAAMLRENSHLC